jgi:AcrR family transcriptional regulator
MVIIIELNRGNDMSAERGRPRNFDENAVLDNALEVFWRHGFQGASLAELTEAMGLSKPSLYAAFGDKESLYLKTLTRYADVQIAKHAAVLEAEPDGRRAVESYLRSMAVMLTDPDLPGGCFIINGTADCGGSSTPASVELALRAALQRGESRLKERIVRAQREGQLASDISAEDLAAVFGSLLAGLGVIAKSGAKRAKLYAIIKAAMGIWPNQNKS